MQDKVKCALGGAFHLIRPRLVKRECPIAAFTDRKQTDSSPSSRLLTNSGSTSAYVKPAGARE